MSNTNFGDKTRYYSGGAGREYYDQRALYRSAEHQRRRSLHFSGLSQPNFTVLDFGCGSGGVVALLPAQKRLGIEISPDAAADARQLLDEVHDSVSSIQPGSVDLAISFHALEHTATPYEDLRGIFTAMKPSATYRFIVPFEGVLPRENRIGRWRPNDKAMHLFAWTPQTFGNLLQTVGFEVSSCALEPATISERLKFKSVVWMKAILSRKVNVVASGRKPI
jgi:SAM-dependent methyltransferase